MDVYPLHSDFFHKLIISKEYIMQLMIYSKITFFILIINISSVGEKEFRIQNFICKLDMCVSETKFNSIIRDY